MERISVEELTRRASTGDVRAQIVLGWQLLKSKSSPIEQQKGPQYLETAISSGSLEACFRLAFWNETKGNAECVKMFKAASAKGYSPATYELGNMYWTGWLVGKNRRRAGVYWRRAARHGHSLARLRMRTLPLHKPFSDKISKINLLFVVTYTFAMALCEIPGHILNKGQTSHLGRL